MKIAIMQPYFLPYIGYFQLIDAVDQFVVYDNIKYTKKGWINRNRMLVNGMDVIFSLPLKKDSDYLDVVQRQLASDFSRDAMLRKFKNAYAPAPYFDSTFQLLEQILDCETKNLFEFIYNSIGLVCGHIGITTTIRKSSTIEIDHDLKSQAKVLAICSAMGAETYINASGGVGLYSRDVFKVSGVELRFLTSNPMSYLQFDCDFIPWLSIIDVLMFNSLPVIATLLKNCTTQ